MNCFQPAPYPDPAIEVLDSRFNKYRIGNASVERLATGCRWSEGPVYFPAMGCLLWSDIPNNRILRYTEDSTGGHLSIFRQPSNYANGNTKDRAGRLYTCEHGSRRVTRTEYDGTITVLADNFSGKPLNAPNDLIVDSLGHVWFTDPGYGIINDYEGFQAEEELPRCLYRIDGNTGKLSVFADDLVRPNGLALSPDETKLYVVDSAMGHEGRASIKIYDVNYESGKLKPGRIFADDFAPGTTDGIRFDCHGNLWCAMGWGDAGENGVRCYSPDGTLIGKVHLPEICANLCFGGEKMNRLFMTASTSLYALYVGVRGLL